MLGARTAVDPHGPFVICGYQGAEGDSGKLQLTDGLLQAVLGEAQVVRSGQPLLIAGDLVMLILWFPVWLRVFLLVSFVDLALSYFLGRGDGLMLLASSGWRIALYSHGDFIFLGCSDALAASTACSVTDGWFTPHFLYLLAQKGKVVG